MDRATRIIRLRQRRAQCQLLRALLARRYQQDRRHGGPDHDDVHAPKDWVTLVHSYAAAAELRNDDPAAFESKMLDVAALAQAALESGRRKPATETRTGEGN
jgi:hypothetical protein